MSDFLPPPVPIIECPTCHLPVPTSDDLCPHCGSIIPMESFDALR